MTTPDLIKLAPTLSVEERYKIAIAECLRVMAGEQSILSGSEIDAIASFEKNAVWEQYALHVGMFKWANILWTRDIQTAKFAACTCILLLNEALWHMVGDVDDSKGKDVFLDNLAAVRKYVGLLQEKLADFYAYREALPRLQNELYDMPIFDGKRAETIHGFFQVVGETVECHNGSIRELCTNRKIKRHFRIIVQDIDAYLVKEPKIDEAAIVGLMDEVRAYAESDVRARSGK